MVLVSLGKLLSEERGQQLSLSAIWFYIEADWLVMMLLAFHTSSAEHARKTHLLLPVWLRAGLHL